jgi:CBS domain-containing protein
MTSNPMTIDAGVEAAVALQLMLAQGFRHFPVVDGAELIGIVSIRDLSMAVTDQERPGP